MKIFRSVGAAAKKIRRAVIAIGVFDGVHLGHQRLIRTAVKAARSLRSPSLVMTFDPHPVHVLRPQIPLPLIVSLDHRLKLISDLDVDATVVVRFTKAFSKLSPAEFIQKYLVKPFSPTAVIVGDDFRFGQNREGTIDIFRSFAAKYGFKVLAVKTRQSRAKKKSSSTVRELIVQGKLKEASRVLGRPVSLSGKVVPGDGRGKALGFPTANIKVSQGILPPIGVYVVRVQSGAKKLSGMANVGVRPSFYKSGDLTVEAHLFGFKQKIYGKEATIEFLEKIRNEMRFSSQEDLVIQLKSDERFAKTWFSRRKS